MISAKRLGARIAADGYGVVAIPHVHAVRRRQTAPTSIVGRIIDTPKSKRRVGALWRLCCFSGAVLPGSTAIVPHVGSLAGADLASRTAAGLEAGAASYWRRRRAVAAVAQGPAADIGAGLCTHYPAEAQQGKGHQEQHGALACGWRLGEVWRFRGRPCG